MRSLFEKKPWVLLLSILAVGALVVLSVSLRNVSFSNAQPIGREEAEELPRPSQPVLAESSEEALSSQIILVIALIVLIALVGVLLSPEGRKRMFIFLLRMAFTLWALYFVFNRYPGMFDFLEVGLAGEAPRSPSVETGASVPPPVFTPPQETPIPVKLWSSSSEKMTARPSLIAIAL